VNTFIVAVTLWFLLGLVAKGIIRGNTIEAINKADMNNRKDNIGVYWMLRWERVAFLLGPIGLFQVIKRRFQLNDFFSLRKFSLKRHKKQVRLSWLPSHYYGRLIKSK
jgi:hypothetical protein